MMRLSRLRSRFRLWLAAISLAGLSCGDATAPPEHGGASYSVSFDPGRMVQEGTACDRLLTHAVLDLGLPERGRPQQMFELSINIVQDCSEAGDGYAFWEVYMLGTYAAAGTQLTFVPQSSRIPLFPGSIDGNYLKLTLPARPDSLAATPIPLELGPRRPY